MECLCYITTEAQRTVMGNVSSKTCVKCKLISPGEFLCHEFTSLPLSWFSAATSTSDLPNWKTSKQQMPGKASKNSSFETVALREIGIVNSVLSFSSYGHLRTQRLCLAELYQLNFEKRNLNKFFILSCTSCLLRIVCNSWADIPGYNMNILASREEDGL